jgi:hypothetical protein
MRLVWSERDIRIRRLIECMTWYIGLILLILLLMNVELVSATQWGKRDVPVQGVCVVRVVWQIREVTVVAAPWIWVIPPVVVIVRRSCISVQFVDEQTTNLVSGSS